MNDTTIKQYKVTIEEITAVTTLKRGGYGVIEERLYSAEEKEKAQIAFNSEDRDMNKDIKGQEAVWPVKRVYGYAPEIETTTTQNIKIYEQTVADGLNIQAVITAVNTLPIKG
jgi:hypothetical protein